MRVNVIDIGSYDSSQAFNAIFHGGHNMSAINYLKNNINSLYNNFGDIGASFFNKTKNFFNRFNDEDAINKAKILASRGDDNFYHTAIHNVTLANINNISHTMKRYMVSNPQVNRLITEGNCEAYNDEYFSVDNMNTPVEERYDYMRVMSGIHEDDSYITYSQEDHFDEGDLSTFEKTNIKEAWDIAMNLIANGIDPTSEDLEDL